MTKIVGHHAAASNQLPATMPPRVAGAKSATGSEGASAAGVAQVSRPALKPLHGKGQSPEELKAAFTQFVGETFFGQMIKSMRSTVGKPAYFYGGRAEEAFQGQLDQQLSQHLTEASAAKFADPLFARQFPHLAEQTKRHDLNQLSQLPRR